MKVIRTIIFLLVCVGLIWLIVLIFSKVFIGNTQTEPADTSHLRVYARQGTAVQYTMDGSIVENESHRAVRITVDSTQSKIELLGGYEGSVLRQEMYPNSMNSYATFLSSLDSLGFTKGTSDTSSQGEQGQCPLQQRYIYRLTDAEREVYRYWSTSCGAGSFGGARSSVRTLFSRQVPLSTYQSYIGDLE